MASTKTKTDRLLLNEITIYDSQAYTTGETAVPNPSYLLKALVSNSNASARWLTLFNSTTASGTPALAPFEVPGNGSVEIDFTVHSGANSLWGASFPTALTWASSSAAVFAQSDSLWVTLYYAS